MIPLVSIGLHWFAPMFAICDLSESKGRFSNTVFRNTPGPVLPTKVKDVGSQVQSGAKLGIKGHNM